MWIATSYGIRFTVKLSQKGILLLVLVEKLFCFKMFFFFSALVVVEQTKTVAAPPVIAKETVLLQVLESITDWLSQ